MLQCQYMILELANGQEDETAYIDDDDIGLVNGRRWLVLRQKRDGYTNRYVVCYEYSENDWTAPKTIYLHRLLIQPPKGMLVDHINGDGLDNRRGNLRAVTHSQNQLNRHR